MKLTLSTDKASRLALCLLATYAATMLPLDALATTAGASGQAGSGSTIASLLCGVASWFTSGVGAGIATLAIIIIGIGALMGKVSWGMAIIVALGVTVIFGAPSLVADIIAMTNSNAQACT